MSQPTRSGLLLIILVVAFLLRAWHPERIAIEHFDEGVYASNFFSGHLNNRYPDQHLYAPPLWPALLEWVLILSDANPHAVMWVNIFLGTALVAAVWWTTRVLVEPAESGEKSDDPPTIPSQTVAFGAAVLVAFSGLLIEYSRGALTDIPLVLLVTLSVGTGVKALRDEGPFWLLATAGLTALAWWTKYNGWLPLAILGAGLAGWSVATRAQFRQLIVPWRTWLIIASVAFLLWSPVLWQLQNFGGYASVARNHAGYVVGLSGWWDSAIRMHQVSNHYLFGPMITSQGIGIAIAVVALFVPILRAARGTESDGPIRIWTSLALLVGLTVPLLLGMLPGLIILSLPGALAGLRKGLKRTTLEGWILAAWVIGLIVATPLYRPYPRLMLPLHVGLCISTAVGLSRIADWLCRRQSRVDSELVFGSTTATIRLFVLATAGCLIVLTGPSGLYERRDGLQQISREIISMIPPTSAPLDAIVYVLAEPGLYYHLAAHSGRPEIIAQPASNLGMLQPGAIDLSVPTYLVTGPHAEIESLQLAEERSVVAVAEIAYPMSRLVLLDEWSPSQLSEHRTGTARLWRIVVTRGTPAAQ